MGNDYYDIWQEERQNERDRHEPPEHPRSMGNPNYPFDRLPKCVTELTPAPVEIQPEPPKPHPNRDLVRDSMKAKREAEERRENE